MPRASSPQSTRTPASRGDGSAGADDEQALAALRAQAHPITGGRRDYDPLIELIGEARIVLLGEASYGTQEAHRERAAISRRLIAEHGFTAVAIEGDRSDAQRVDRFVRGAHDDLTAADALNAFRQFPSWMWRNREVAAFVSWLRSHNEGCHFTARKVGFYGIDRGSLSASAEPVLAHAGGGDHAQSWNERDRYMADALDCLLAYLNRYGGTAKVVVWVHNSHAGDARVTELAARGEVSLGQLMRERHGGEVASVGFTTYDGTVTAASRWGGQPRCTRLQRPADGALESLLHQAGAGAFMLCPLGDRDGGATLEMSRPQRAIGAVYRPKAERSRDWLSGAVAHEFDALLHIDSTHAAVPLEDAGD